jgi:TolA-binding protein
MHGRTSAIGAILAILLAASGAAGQSELLYDPEKGIMFVDKNDSAKKSGSAKPLVTFDKKTGKDKAVGETPARQVPGVQTRESTDLHVGRKKDPPTLYFTSGLEYYKNGDYANALHNFSYADSIGRNPAFRLWMGKTYRQLNKPEKMLSVFREIVQKRPECDVADDALFEMAAFYQDSSDYETAARLYTQLSEQYPFGESYATGERYIEVARDQRKMMRAEMSNMLAILKYTDENIETNYREFQQNHGLQVTGSGNQQTIRAIKLSYQKMLDRERKNAQVKEQAKRYLLWAGGAGVLGLLNILLLLAMLLRTGARNKQLVELRETLLDLDARRV